jgi:hypothetical protein
MNVPSIYRKALEGFIIPPRSFFQMFVGASKGAISLFDEGNRSDFIAKLDKGIINEGVISQATAGPMVMLSLFNDLQNPLFTKYDFDPSQFLEGVGPALENYHNVSGALENELYNIASLSSSVEATEKDESDDSSNDETGTSEGGKIAGMSKEEHDAILSTISMLQKQMSSSADDNHSSSILKHDWTKEGKEKPDSIAGQLSSMLTTELFEHYQLSAKTTFLLQNPSRRLKYQEDSSTVNNVALLSARAFRCIENEENEESNASTSSSSAYQIVEYADEEEGEQQKPTGGVAAQMEVLYDVTSHFVIDEKSSNDEDSEKSDDEESELKDMETTVVSVAVLEGFLNGGPEGKLKWRLALHRPAFEFPGMQQAY